MLLILNTPFPTIYLMALPMDHHKYPLVLILHSRHLLILLMVLFHRIRKGIDNHSGIRTLMHQHRYHRPGWVPFLLLLRDITRIRICHRERMGMDGTKLSLFRMTGSWPCDLPLR